MLELLQVIAAVAGLAGSGGMAMFYASLLIAGRSR